MYKIVDLNSHLFSCVSTVERISSNILSAKITETIKTQSTRDHRRCSVCLTCFYDFRALQTSEVV